jgi:hypothetical protein
MADLTKLLEALGFGASTITAAATVYGVFKFLDTKASGPAKAAIIGWIKDETYKRVDLKASVVSSFDHLYGMPLWSVKAAFRSCVISTLAFLLWLLILRFKFTFIRSLDDSLMVIEDFLIFIIISDYASLFVVRNFLLMATASVARSVFLALVFACLTITCSAFLGLIALWGGLDWFSFDALSASGISPLDFLFLLFKYVSLLVAPALLVHLWLPLFFIGAMINRMLDAFFRTVGWAQWFIKRGNLHPYEAIGIASSVAVLLAGGAWQVVSYFAPL